MATMITEVPQDLQGKEISLKHIGVNGVAWKKDDAIDLLNSYKLIGKFVLGGDVLAYGENGYSHNYDNWYFNYEDGNAKESVNHAIKYINNYPDGDFAFILVVDEVADKQD